MNKVDKFSGIEEFVSTIRTGSFTAAALELGLSKSAVGKAVSRLEERLDTKLLHRSTRRLKLTAEGEAYLSSCLSAIESLDNIEEVFRSRQQKASGALRVDLPGAFGRRFVVPILVSLAKHHPDLTLAITLTDRKIDLIQEGVDLVVRIGSLEESSELVARSLGIQRQVICASPDYLSRYGKPERPEELIDHCYLAGYNRKNPFVTLFRKNSDESIKLKVPVRHELGDGEATLDGVLAGLGVAMLPTWMVDDHLRRGELIEVLTGYSGGDIPISVVWPRTRSLLPRVRVAVDALVQNFTTESSEGFHKP